ncbi:MAG: methyltransferase domain-containing protein, partial [Bacteroidales bacterium]
MKEHIVPKHMVSQRDIFCCPVCRKNLTITEQFIKCKRCKKEFEIKNNIPLLFADNDHNGFDTDVTSKIKAFYEKSPFPNYDDIENLYTLIQKSKRSIFADMLEEQIPFNSRVLEIGTGTGQFSNFLGISQRYIFGADMTFNSLKLGEEFRARYNLDRVGFYQMNLFKPVFKENTFSYVLCLGVLHHTNNPFLGFKKISELVAPKGYIIVGLYNKYGRLITGFRKWIFRLSRDRFKWI